MLLDSFFGRSAVEALSNARGVMGHDAVIIQTRHTSRRGERHVEVLAAPATIGEDFGDLNDVSPLPNDSGVTRIAVVGPTGAGKTTATVKLALSERTFGDARVGLINLDTYRVGAMEQIGAYARVAGLSIETVYSPADAPGALARLADCDVVLIDTPGRSLTDTSTDRDWLELTRSFRPHETHLVLPVHMNTAVARSMTDHEYFRAATHLLPSKLDEVGDPVESFRWVLEMGLEYRWMSSGQTVPSDLTDGREILTAIGFSPRVNEEVA